MLQLRTGKCRVSPKKELLIFPADISIDINDYEGYDHLDQEDEWQASEDGVLGILPELDHDSGAISKILSRSWFMTKVEYQR